MNSEERIDILENTVAALKQELAKVQESTSSCELSSLTTQRLILQDEKKRPRIIAAMSNNGPFMHFKDDKGKTQLALGLDDKGDYGPWIFLYEDGKPRAEITITKKAPAIAFFDPEGKSTLIIESKEAGASLTLQSSGRNRFVHIKPTDLDFFADGYQHVGICFSEGKRSGFYICDKKGETRAELVVTRKGPEMEFFDSRGRRIWKAN